MVLKSIQVLSIPLNMTGRRAITYGWNYALEMEMYNIGVAFEILEDGETAPAGYTKVSGHLIWSVKMDFTKENKMGARWSQDTRSSWFQVCLKRECMNCFRLCSLK